ncbi:MerR family transcriptional regulator [uncultured Thermanaerothrix sp.]|uniref:MerR family transcriptional regulator n=1 Tax=uncultured Thermanaerothrix sp. TaxID=1195149 RepID=UPI00260717D9|nr:MerR family transcriptional regulator [uncultured Thermanaerothrix sp.]
MDKPELSHDPHAPVYNIKAVSRLVGLPSVTLRAWERRYGLPRPRRGHQGYRLYSEYDLHLLRWLKQQVDTGISIGRAVEYWHELRSMGRDPVAEQTRFSPTAQPISPNHLARDLYAALTHFDEEAAAEVLRRASALYTIDQVLTEVVQPMLVEIGEAWHRGELPIAVEHFATQFCLQHLMSLLAASAPPRHPGIIVAACAPGETHQIGLLMLVVMLRWRGWDVKYLGQDLKLEGMAEALGPLKPRLLLFSATRPEIALNLLDLPTALAAFPDPKPWVVLGGQAFEGLRLPKTIPAVYLQAPLLETVTLIERLMQEHTPKTS